MFAFPDRPPLFPESDHFNYNLCCGQTTKKALSFFSLFVSLPPRSHFPSPHPPQTFRFLPFFPHTVRDKSIVGMRFACRSRTWFLPKKEELRLQRRSKFNTRSVARAQRLKAAVRTIVTLRSRFDIEEGDSSSAKRQRARRQRGGGESMGLPLPPCSGAI